MRIRAQPDVASKPVLVLDLRSMSNKQDHCLSQNWSGDDKYTAKSPFAVSRKRFLTTNQHKLLYRLSTGIHALLGSLGAI